MIQFISRKANYGGLSCGQFIRAGEESERTDMCYSLAASLSTGLGLGCIGTILVNCARTHNRRMIVYACFPLVFSIHQLIEGVNWYALQHPFKGDGIFLYGYSIIAFGFWPILIPLAAMVAEQRYFWRRIWRVCVGIGLTLSAYLWGKLALSDGIDVSVVKHSLAYKPLFSDPPNYIIGIYVVLTTAPSIIMKNRAVNLFGWLVLFGFFLSLIESKPAWYSVWCMMSAISSIAIVFAITKNSKQQDKFTS